MTQMYMTASIRFKLRGTVFTPSPKVNASQVVLEPLSNPLLAPNIPFHKASLFVREAFSNRRKKLGPVLGRFGIDCMAIEKHMVVGSDGKKLRDMRPQELLTEVWAAMIMQAHRNGSLDRFQMQTTGAVSDRDRCAQISHEDSIGMNPPTQASLPTTL